mmetsp:Transcript_13690/g.20849  ORF Transcript_13690/g.20849 Transcript_13690/m.20849 type:complete len:94 (-) Transcript_13690:561-842(-)
MIELIRTLDGRFAQFNKGLGIDSCVATNQSRETGIGKPEQTHARDIARQTTTETQFGLLFRIAEGVPKHQQRPDAGQQDCYVHGKAGSGKQIQ